MDGPSTNYIDTGLLAGEQYVYYVTASNSFGESLPSDSVRMVPLAPTQTVLPWAPWDLEAVGGDGRVNLSWAPPRNAGEFTITGYRIYWLSQKWTAGGLHYVPPLEGSYWSVVDVQGTSTSYTHEGLTNGEEYYYHVSALTPVGEGGVSPYVSATPLALPSAPWGLWGTLGVGEIYIHWEPPDEIGDVGIFTYKVLRGETPDDMGPLVDLDWTWWDWGLYEFPPNEYTDEDLGGHEFWYYQVIAVNRLGEGPPSNFVRVPPIPEPPTAPLDLEATTGENEIELLWKIPMSPGSSIIKGYYLYRWQEGEQGQTIFVLDPETFSFIDNDVEKGLVYFYAVSAINSVGEGPLSNEVSATLPGAAPEIPGPDVEASSFLVGNLGMILLLVVVVLCFVVSTLYLRT
ncbi:MAG: fibronectin type III domain-containing protein, partial [Thermoplasmata archaeon]|nr:fibronectin type III domain-containing protein [Thermoplasmata archaeon]